MILVRKRQPDGQHSHDRVSTKEHIRTIFDAPLSGRLATFGEFLRADSRSTAGDVCYGWNANRRVAHPSAKRRWRRPASIDLRRTCNYQQQADRRSGDYTGFGGTCAGRSPGASPSQSGVSGARSLLSCRSKTAGSVLGRGVIQELNAKINDRGNVCISCRFHMGRHRFCRSSPLPWLARNAA